MAMALYDLNNVAQDYDGRTVLSIDRWQVDANAVTGVVGPNGSGKSTFLALLGFITAPARGEIRFKGEPAEPFSARVRGIVALLPQETFLLKRSVYRNIAYGLQVSRPVGNIEGRVHTAMDMVGLDPGAFAHRPWYALSGGEARRVALAARLALEPEVLLLDEPTVSVDAASAQMIKDAALHASQQWGTTLIISSHDEEWLSDICDNMLQLFRGRILGNGEQTLIFGPWKAMPGNLAGKALTDDQQFLAGGPPEDFDSAVAAIQADKLDLYTAARLIPAGSHGLEGLLLRLNYQQSTGRTSAAVLVGRLVLTAYLPKSEPFACNYAPGKKVWIAYNPNTVDWY